MSEFAMGAESHGVLIRTGSQGKEGIMDNKVFDLSDAVAMAERAVAKKGADWIHRNDPNRHDGMASGDCYNAFKIVGDDDESEFVPGCIAGTILADENIISAEEMYLHTASTSFGGTLSEFGKDDLFTDAAEAFVTHVQIVQDRGVTWGESVARGIANIIERAGNEHSSTTFTEKEREFLRERKV